MHRFFIIFLMSFTLLTLSAHAGVRVGGSDLPPPSPKPNTPSYSSIYGEDEGDFNNQQKAACRQQGGIPTHMYGRTICNRKTSDFDKKCGVDIICQGLCLSISDENHRQHRISNTPTEDPLNPGRCSPYQHIKGCVTLVSGFQKCSY